MLGLILAAVALSIASTGCGGSAEEVRRESARAYAAGDHDAAAAAAIRATRIDPASAESWFRLGLAESARQRWSAATDAYRRVIELDPTHAKALHNMGNVYVRQGLYEQAAVWYGRAVEVDPAYQLALFNYGWVLRQLNEGGRAEEMFRRCLEIDAADPRTAARRLDCLYYLATLRFRDGDYGSAATMLEQVLAVHPAHAEARHFLGMAYRHLGRLAEAEQQLALHKRLLEAARAEPIPPQDQP